MFRMDFRKVAALVSNVAMVGTVILAFAEGVAAQQTRLYFFTQPNCPPCVRMIPAIDDLIQRGFPVTTIDVRQQPEWARQFQIDQTPTVVVFDGQRQIVRQEGYLDGAQLQNVIRHLTPQSLPAATSNASVELVPLSRSSIASHHPTGVHPLDGTVATGTPAPTTEAERRALAATVRLRLETAHDISFATGTIIHSQGNEALVVTCGHIFRDSAGQGRLTADVGWLNGRIETVPAQLIDYDADSRDVALVVIRTETPCVVASVAPRERTVSDQDSVFSIGCDRGDSPTIRHTIIKNVTAYCGATKYDTIGRPVVGRSGGGLFNRAGELIGVCNAAAVDVDEGIYTALENIYWQLARSNLAHLFPAHGDLAAQPFLPSNSAASPSITLATRDSTRDDVIAPVMMPAAITNDNRRLDGPGNRNEGLAVSPEFHGAWEAIIVLRNSAFPDQPQTFTVRNPDLRALSTLVGRELTTGHAQDQIESTDSSRMARIPSDMSILPHNRADRDAVIRAQSPR